MEPITDQAFERASKMTDVRPPTVQDQLARVGARCEELAAVIDSLADRLAPVLVPESDSVYATGVAELVVPEASRVALELDVLGTRILGMTRRLAEISDRVNL